MEGGRGDAHPKTEGQASPGARHAPGDEPDRFLLSRGDPSRTNFGACAHYCLGATLARLELDVTIERLAHTFPDLALTSDPIREAGF